MAHARVLTRELESRGPFRPDRTAEGYRAARAAWMDYRRANGFRTYGPLLSPPSSNVKMRKSETATYGLSLAPAEMSGLNLCAWSTAECRAACVLVTAGKGTLPSVRRARVVKSRWLAEDPSAFVTLLWHESMRTVRKHGAVVIRLNVASDIRWERIAPEVFDVPGARFYDYTKAPVAQRDALEGYRLTYSVSERAASERNAVEAMEALANAAVVFERTDAGLPETWRGFPVVDGDISDDRTLDPPGTVVGLLAKGSARKAEGRADGFVKPAIDS